MIEFSHAYKTYDNGYVALRDVNFSVDRGEFVYLTGPSGAGKTSLFRLISAYDKATSGRIKVAGHELDCLRLSELPYFRRKIGVIYQEFRLLNSRTIYDNVALPLVFRGDSKQQIHRRVMDILDSVNLTDRAKDLAQNLSGGEQQRVAIARAVVHQPSILVADEPTGNLDFQLSLEIMELLEKANAQGTTVFVATHDLELVRKKPKRILSIQSGHLTEAAL